jgi:hypothetical protein
LSQTTSHIAAQSAQRDHVIRAITRAGASATPFRHWLVAELVPTADAVALHDLPIPAPLGLAFAGRRETNNATRFYFDVQAIRDHEPARRLAETFQHSATIAAIQAHTGADLAGCNLRIEYAQDTDGFWLEPHTDLGVKRFSLLFYLSRGPGVETWGTDLYSDAPGHPHALSAPSPFNSATIFVPGTDTWHGFERRPLSHVRKSIILNYVTSEWRARHELAYPETPVRA